jgi:DNA repair/transcription protein MET18/MMS19
MDVPRIVKTQITTGELDPPADLVTGQLNIHEGIGLDLTYAGINDGKIQMLEVVRALGEYLTSIEDGVRLKGKLPC